MVTVLAPSSQRSWTMSDRELLACCWLLPQQLVCWQMTILLGIEMVDHSIHKQNVLNKTYLFDLITVAL
jgi:hypothetical protein